MGLRVVSTKLTEEEHSKLLDLCNKEGCTPSSLIKQAVIEKIEPRTEVKPRKSVDEMSLEELLQAIEEENKQKQNQGKNLN